MRSGFIGFEPLPVNGCGWVMKIVGCEYTSDSEAMVRRIDGDTFLVAGWTVNLYAYR